MVAGLKYFARIQIKHAAAQAGEVVLDLEVFEGFVFRQHFFHQMA